MPREESSGEQPRRKKHQAKLYDFEGVKRAYGKLLETDLAIKTGQYSDKLALELLVTELACLDS